MQLIETGSFWPQKQALFVHSSYPCLATHPSGRYISFQTRNNELILSNTATGRTITLFSSPHTLTSITFTHKYLVATHQTCRELLIFSLKTQKLKSRLTGHRGDITNVAYCRQRQMIASISHDLCLIYSESTLSHVKSLKCSTSSFVDVAFNENGSALGTSFKDGTIMFWNIDEWTFRQSHVIAHSPKIALTNTIAAVYDSKRFWLGDMTKETILYQQIDSFWEGNIKQLLFLDYTLVMSTDQGLYLIEINNENSFKIVQVRKVSTVASYLSYSDYQTTLVSLSNNYKQIQFLKIQDLKSTISKVKGSPLTNQGIVCAGGYSKEEGCLLEEQTNYINTNTNNNYTKHELKVESMIQGAYTKIPSSMSLSKLKQFLRKHYCLPDKYRPLAYRQALNLPVAPEQFKELERKGQHPAVELLQSNYPIENQYLKQKVKEIMSLLAHWSPVLGQSHDVPTIVFPFVCLLGQDVFMCFQVLYRLFSGPLGFMFKEYPLANSQVLQNMWEIVKKEDPILVSHLESKQISFVKLIWTLISTLFTSTLTRQGVLAIIDSILIRNDEPETILFLSLGYLIFNRKRILSAETEKTALKLCEEEQTIHLAKYLNTSFSLQQKYRKDIRCLLTISENIGSYTQLDFPLDSVKMHQTRTKIFLEELHKQKEAENHREVMLADFQKISTNARREAERQTMEQEAYRHHCDLQKNRKIELKEIDRKDRIVMIEKMMDELVSSLQQQKKGRQLFRQYIPTVENIKESASDEKLNEIEIKLMKLLEEVRPGNNSLKLLASHPANLHKGGSVRRELEGAVGANLTKKLWELDQEAKKNQGVIFENRILATFK